MTGEHSDVLPASGPVTSLGDVRPLTSPVNLATSRVTLGPLGISPDQETAYRVLLDHGWTDLNELSVRTGLASVHLQNCLDVLGERGLIQVGANGLTIPDPRVAVGALIEHAEDSLMAQYRRVSSLRTELGRFAPAPEGPRADGHSDIERLTSVEAVRTRISELAFFARSSVLAIHPGGPQSVASIEASRPLDRRAARRGTQVRVIHESAVLDDDLNRAYLLELTALGVHVRVSPTVPKRVVILDEEVAVVPIDPADSRAGALVVRQAGLVAGLVDLFRHAWDGAEEVAFEAAADDGDSPIDDIDRRLLVLLSSGCTDELAAREFAISVRHLRRRIARLMALLGARSRFEAGVEASRRGWL